MIQTMAEIDRLETALRNAKIENERLRNVNHRLRVKTMTETLKDFQRIEREKWEHLAQYCPCKGPTISPCGIVKNHGCCFESCPFVYWGYLH